MPRVSARLRDPKRAAYAVAAALAVVSATMVVVLSRPARSDSEGLPAFQSRAELAAFLEDNAVDPVRGGFGADAAVTAVPDDATMQADTAVSAAGADTSAAARHTSTNVQVPGVDEADLVKTDGRHIYAVTGGRVAVVDARPPDRARVVAEIPLPSDDPRNLYLAGDRLVVLGGHGVEPTPSDPVRGDVVRGRQAADPGPRRTFVRVYDVQDPADPRLVRDVRVDGSIRTSRRVDGHVYVVLTMPAPLGDDGPRVPKVDADQTGFPEIHYVDSYDRGYRYVNVLSVDVRDADAPTRSETYLLGRTAEIHVSRGNLYLVTPNHVHPEDRFEMWVDDVVLPEVPARLRDDIRRIRDADRPPGQRRQDVVALVEGVVRSRDDLRDRLREQDEAFEDRIERLEDRSDVHRIALDQGRITYRARGSVPGEPMGRFSMDEHAGHFRIATTSDVGESENNLYVLDMEMQVVGSVEGLAPGEEIRSARFLGRMAYLVTFEIIDPLFAIDVSDPTQPRVLGELKVTGVSEYLHPVGGDRLLGVGRASHVEHGRPVFDGLKVALYNVSQPQAPRLADANRLGVTGSDSAVLDDHKAFTFDARRDLAVVPARIMPAHAEDRWDHEAAWQGAYVVRVHDARLEPAAWIQHQPAESLPQSSAIRRSRVIGDALYTVSEAAIEIHVLPGLDRIQRVELA